MPDDEAQTSQSRDHDDSPQAPTAAPSDGVGDTPDDRYRLGKPHPNTVSLDQLRDEIDDMDDAARERLGQHIAGITKSITTQVGNALQDAVSAAVQGSRWIQTFKLSVADTARTFYFLASDEWLRPIAELLNETFSTLQRLPVRIMRAGAPPNWASLTDDELKALPDIAVRGIPVAWVPRLDVLRELVAADPSNQLAVLTKYTAEIVDDCAAVVAETSAGAFFPFTTFLEEAIAVYRAGHVAAAQALAASVLDTLFRAAVLPPEKCGYYRKIKDTITEQGKWLPGAVAHLPILPTLDTFFGDEDPSPTTFNRHASVHAVSAVQYTDANAVVALMLTTSILREAHRVEHELPDEDEPAAGSASDLA